VAELSRAGGAAAVTTDGRHRLWLTRDWNTASYPRRVFWVGMNPSTADAAENDPTIRRMIAFSKREGADGMMVLNLSTFRATDPAHMLAAQDKRTQAEDFAVIGDQLVRNRGWVYSVVACWGALKWERSEAARRWLPEACRAYGMRLLCLGTTQNGSPRHPLYVRGDQPFFGFGLQERHTQPNASDGREAP